MTKNITLFIAALAAVAGLSFHAHANVDERYAELQMVPEAINDPDPLMRLAQLEAIIAEDDAAKIQLALRTAFTVDDPNVRALALRAHFASYRTVVIQVEIPEEVQLAVKDGSRERKYANTATFLDGVGGQISLYIDYQNISQVEMPFMSLNHNERRDARLSGTGNIRGTTITFSGPVAYGPVAGANVAACSFEFHQYEGFLVRGEGSCDMTGGAMPFPVALRLF